VPFIILHAEPQRPSAWHRVRTARSPPGSTSAFPHGPLWVLCRHGGPQRLGREWLVDRASASSGTWVGDFSASVTTMRPALLGKTLPFSGKTFPFSFHGTFLPGRGYWPLAGFRPKWPVLKTALAGFGRNCPKLHSASCDSLCISAPTATNRFTQVNVVSHNHIKMMIVCVGCVQS
jgi:hypothetical protein